MSDVPDYYSRVTKLPTTIASSTTSLGFISGGDSETVLIAEGTGFCRNILVLLTDDVSTAEKTVVQVKVDGIVATNKAHDGLSEFNSYNHPELCNTLQLLLYDTSVGKYIAQIPQLIPFQQKLELYIENTKGDQIKYQLKSADYELLE